MTIVLRADYGYDALLYGFDLGGWFETDYEIAAVSVYDADYNGSDPTLNRVFHEANSTVSGAGPTHTSHTFGTPIRGNVITIFINAANIGAASELSGIDNIRFGQDVEPDPGPPTGAIPEPQTITLMTAGLAAVALLARRNLRFARTPIPSSGNVTEEFQ